MVLLRFYHFVVQLYLCLSKIVFMLGPLLLHRVCRFYFSSLFVNCVDLFLGNPKMLSTKADHDNS